MIKSIYIHIPFCNQICSYCDFCKFLYNEAWADKYLDSLMNEIHSNYKNELIDTLYIGGGTPSNLNLKQLKKLFDILKTIRLNNNYEFTFECNVNDLTKDKLELLYKNKVNRLSIGVQTFNEKHLELLNRKHTKKQVVDKINLAKKIGIKNINIDLIYAIPNETLQELEYDISTFLELDITHISTYSLMIEPNTKLYINKTENIDQDLDYKMYELINKKLSDNGFKHYEISNYSKEKYESKHNLTYWNNKEYYGFGLGSCGYVDGVRYENTRNLNKYLQGYYISESNKLTLKETIENEFILGFRKTDGIKKQNFKFYNINNNDIIKQLIEKQELIDDGNNIFINPEYLYISNRILVNFIDS